MLGRCLPGIVAVGMITPRPSVQALPGFVNCPGTDPLGGGDWRRHCSNPAWSEALQFLFGPAIVTMQQFMWQDNLVRVAHFVFDCFASLQTLGGGQ